MGEKRSRAKYTHFVATNVTEKTNDKIEAIIDAQIAEGREGFAKSDLLREACDLAIKAYNPNGKGKRPKRRRKQAPAPAPAPAPTVSTESKAPPAPPSPKAKFVCEQTECPHNVKRYCTVTEYPKDCKLSVVQFTRLVSKRPASGLDALPPLVPPDGGGVK